MLSLENAIKQFLETAQQLQFESELKADMVLDKITQFYRDIKIKGANKDPGNDMLLFQWGTEKPLIIDKPMDFRKYPYLKKKYEESERKYLDFTRQVYLSGKNDDFDGSAIQMSMTLIYEQALGDEPSSNQWFKNPSNFALELQQYKAVPFVHSLFNSTVSRLNAKVNFCG